MNHETFSSQGCVVHWQNVPNVYLTIGPFSLTVLIIILNDSVSHTNILNLLSYRNPRQRRRFLPELRTVPANKKLFLLELRK